MEKNWGSSFHVWNEQIDWSDYKRDYDTRILREGLKEYGYNETRHSRASSHKDSLTNPLWVKHRSQINAYRELGELISWSSSPRSASATLSYHRFRGGPMGKGLGAAETSSQILSTKTLKKSIRVSWARSVGGMGDLPIAVPCRRGVTGFCFDMARSLKGFAPGGSSSYSWNNFTIESKFVFFLISSTFARRCFIKFWSDFSVWCVRREERKVCSRTFCVGLSSVPYLHNTSNEQNAGQWSS